MQYPSVCGPRRRRYAPQINNLGGGGPETEASSRVMRYQSVGFLDGVPFDLLITNTTPVYYGLETCLAGCDDKNDGVFVELPVQVNREYSVSMRFVDPNSGDSDVTLPAFFLSLFDLDSSPSYSIGNRERITARADTGSYTFTAGDKIDVVGANPNVGITFQNAYSFSGPVKSPNKGLDLTAEQLAVSVTTIVALLCLCNANARQFLSLLNPQATCQTRFRPSAFHALCCSDDMCLAHAGHDALSERLRHVLDARFGPWCACCL